MEPENRYRENGYMTLYERTGVPAAYIDRDGEHIYLFDGSPAAYIHGDAVYGFDGTQYGWFEKGWVRDLDGLCVFFTEEARIGGPAQPSRYETPAKWARAARPIRRSREARHAKTAYKAAWSGMTSGQFFHR